MQEGKIIVEHRTHPRIQEQIHIDYCLFEEPMPVQAQNNKNSLGLNMSFGGIYLKGVQDLKAGNIIRLNLTLPSQKETIPAFAEVVRISGQGAGIRFLVMAEDDEKTLNAHLSKKLADNSG